MVKMTIRSPDNIWKEGDETVAIKSFNEIKIKLVYIRRGNEYVILSSYYL